MKDNKVMYHVREGEFGDCGDGVPIVKRVPKDAKHVGVKTGAVEGQYLVDIYMREVGINVQGKTSSGLNVCNAHEVFKELLGDN